MTEYKPSIGRRKNPGQSPAPIRNYTIPDGASIPSEYIANPDDSILKESFFMNNQNNDIPPDPFGSPSGQQFPPGQFPPGFPGMPQQNYSTMPAVDPRVQYQMQQQQFQQQRIQQRVDDVTRKLDLLLKSTILKKDIVIANDLIFTLRNLTNEQQVKALMSSVGAKFRIEESLILRDWLVAQSIDKVSGMSISDIFGEDTIENRLFLVKKLDDKIAGRLHQEVLVFQEECEKQFGVKSQADFDKLIEEIKKA